jgi:hypothetical protein
MPIRTQKSVAQRLQEQEQQEGEVASEEALPSQHDEREMIFDTWKDEDWEQASLPRH